MRTLALLVALAAALAAAPAGAAKELIAVEVCGVSVCTRAHDARTLHDVPAGGEAETALGPAAPYYRVTFVVGEGRNTHESTLYYIPSQNALAFVDPYDSVRALPIFGPTAKAAIRRLTSGLKPFPTPRVTSVAVGDRVLRGPAATQYLGLYRAGKRASLEYPESWVPIDLRSDEPTPWTEGARELMYSPDAKAIERGGVLYDLPDWLAADVEAARPLHAERSSVRVWLVLAALAAALVAVGVALARRGRARRPTLVGATERV